MVLVLNLFDPAIHDFYNLIVLYYIYCLYFCENYLHTILNDMMSTVFPLKVVPISVDHVSAQTAAIDESADVHTD